MPTLESPRELEVGQEYRITTGVGEDQVGVCRAIYKSDFGHTWGEIELSDETLRVRWNLLAVHPQPPKPEIDTRISVWLCPVCGETGQFAGFCDDRSHVSTRYMYRPCVTVDQLERARDCYIESNPEARGTIESFLEAIFGTPLLGDQ